MKPMPESLDPQDWNAFRELGHQMLDDMLNYLQDRRELPVWQAVPSSVKDNFNRPLPQSPTSESEVYEEFTQYIQPYTLGNTHPRFWGWVMTSGTPLGMLSEMLTGGLNLQMGAGEHSGLYVELQVLDWCKEMLGYPMQSSGVLVSGASMANFVGLTVARNNKAPFDVRSEGLQNGHPRMVAYTSAEAHSCHDKNMGLLGLGSDSLRHIPVNEEYQIDIAALEEAIAADREAGYLPFCVIATAGTVKTGAFDDLEALQAICERENIWLHVDGAFGAFAAVVPEMQSEIAGLDKVDSVALDMHKWMSLPFEVGAILVKDDSAHFKSFTVTADYLEHDTRGAAGAPVWLSDYGLQLSRSFRALKVWMSLKVHGMETHRHIIHKNILDTRYLAELVDETPELERTAPVPLNIVCFRYVDDLLDEEQLNWLNHELLIRLQESGEALVSNATINGHYSLRMANVNHRTNSADFDFLVQKVVELGRELVDEMTSQPV